MLIPQDDFPIHQTAEPLGHPASGDRNHYDRYFFNGYDFDGGLYFAVALGIYPNREVIDAAVSVVRGGVQRSVHASARMPQARTPTAVGPISVEVVRPLQTLRVQVASRDLGLAADLTFEARTVALEEPRFRLHRGTRPVMDYTRLTQWGTWSGWLEVRGERIEIRPEEVRGSRDRSWGVRSVGEPEGGAPWRSLPQFFWLWAPVHFDDVCTHFDVQEEGDGRRWHEFGAVVPLLGSGDGAGGDQEQPAPMQSIGWEIQWEPGTRRARAAEITLTPWDAEPEVIDLEPLLTFQMLGIGYFHPEWGHGMWKGESAVGAEEWVLSDLDPLDIRHIHVQQLCRATMGERAGIGVLEQLAIGPHVPSGLSGLLDGYTP